MRPLPDILEIEPLPRPPAGTVTVPGSKSITNRALILAALAQGSCTLRGALWADDTEVMVESLRRLGFAVTVQPDPLEECNRTITVEGREGEIPARAAELYVGNAGTAARFLTALVCLGRGVYRIDGDDRMRERPMADLFDALRQLQVGVDAPRNRLPAVITANGLSGGVVTVSAQHSSQFASALLLIAEQARFRLQLAEPDEPYSYIEMTARMVDTFRRDYLIEPDLSSASYFTAINFICGGRIEVGGWPRQSLQMDGRFPEFLPPPAQVSRRRDLGDSVMTLAVCAPFGQEPVCVTEAGRMREQECDRIRALVQELRRVGARAEESADRFTVWPAAPGQLHGADIETYHDHRMAMCFGVLGLKVPGIRIKNPACVRKTFPNFFDKLAGLRA